MTITQNVKESITEYYHRISALWNLAHTPEKQRIHKFLTSIRPKFSQTILCREFSSVSEALESARIVEERRKDIEYNYLHRAVEKQATLKSFDPVVKKPREWIGEWYDPEENPRRLTDKLREELTREGRCWSCRGSGHRGLDIVCPRSKKSEDKRQDRIKENLHLTNCR